MLNALEKVMYPNGTTRALGDVMSGSVSSIIDEVHANTSAITSITAQLSALVDDVGTNTSAISSINTKLEHLTYDSETQKYNMSSGLNVRWHLVAQHHLRANDFDLGENNAGFRNSIYRGKSLGSSVTLEQWDAIQAGTFEGLFIGDYWTINGVKWRIAAFDYWYYRTYPVITDHHVVIVPDNSLDTQSVNSTDTATAFISSALYTAGLTNTNSAIEGAFSSGHILTIHESYTSSVSGGQATNWSYVDVKAVIMNEVMIAGTPVTAFNRYEISFDTIQLPLFALDPTKIPINVPYWTRVVADATSYTVVGDVGRFAPVPASTEYGIRPAFAIYNPITQQNSTRKKASKKKGE